MSTYKIKKTPGDTIWFRNARFGMFIHFGLYAMPARHEWIKKREMISEDKYDKYFQRFNPDLFDAKQWAKAAKKAGMKYAVLTTKHHEGFCLFDSKYTDYKITNTVFGRDLVKEYVDAFRDEGIKIGFYYSLIDWHHPDFNIDYIHPRRNDENAMELDKNRNMTNYAAYMRNQVEELLSNYGKIDIIWYDYSYPKTEDDINIEPDIKSWMKYNGGKGREQWEADKLIELTRRLQPNIIINNRADVEQDLWTPEQYQVMEWLKDGKTGEYLTWEACHTFSGSWGYYRDEQTWKSPKMLIDLLINTVSVGGNLLMNVGPTARGYFDYRAERSLNVFEEWMKYNSRSIYGCTMAEPEFNVPRGTRLTQSEDGKFLYIHLIEYPYAFLEMKGLAGKIEYAQLLEDGSEILYTEGEVDHFSEGKSISSDLVVFKLPEIKPKGIVPVIEVELKV